MLPEDKFEEMTIALVGEARQRFQEELERWEEITKPLVEAIHDSERLSDQDFAIRINTRG